MSEIFNTEALRDRARDLSGLNGFDLVFVELDNATTPPTALLTAEFLNDTALADILDDFQNNGIPANQLFSIEGGQRRLGGTLPGQVQVVDISAGPGPAPGLVLRVTPIGDYSSYRLMAVHDVMDPIFATISFKFRPGCFNLNCRSDVKDFAPPDPAPLIDYLARDYNSFKHLLIAGMMDRVPGWQPTSEADLDMVIINLLAARGDELADKQDRVATEAFFPRARKRLSLARHARLMDYHIHQGNQAGTWLSLQVTGTIPLLPNFACWTGRRLTSNSQIFVHDTRDLKPNQDRVLAEILNTLSLYTWGGLVGALEKGSTSADVTLSNTAMTETEATDLRDALLNNLAGPLLIEEVLNPETGRPAGRDPRQRQLLRLIDVETRFDPHNDDDGTAWMVRISWVAADALTSRYCFVTRCPGEDIEQEVSLFYGNLVPVVHGQPQLTLFTDPNRRLDAALAADLEAERSAFRNTTPWGRLTEARYEETNWGRLCPLPEAPLAYRDTPPGGEIAPVSSLTISVENIPDWSEEIDFIQSREDSNHFIVETDETGRSSIRFGRTPNGEAPPSETYVAARYQTGIGSQGNIGADSLVSFDGSLFAGIQRVWNPFDVTSGRLPESPEVIRRRVPEAYRTRQQRAVTLNDYRKRAEELPFVQRAAAAYVWTGSWRSVRVTLDPIGSTALDNIQLNMAFDYLDKVRLIGEDLEIRPPDFVPLDIFLMVCAQTRIWPEDLRFELEEVFSDGYTANGDKGFFHPDLWTFGQSLYASQIIGRALEVEGVDRVLKVGMRFWDRAGGPSSEILEVNPEDLPPPEALQIDVSDNQIIQVANNPDALEFGRMIIEVTGGRR